LQVEGRPDIIIDVSKPDQLKTLVDKPFTIKEGAQYRMKVKFKVQHQILSGLKYLQVAKRMGMGVKDQEMLVCPSYSLFSDGLLTIR
jgi:Rho GDP-dissociation inhibitor